MFVLLCLMLLSACTTDQASYRQQLQNWVGMSQEALYYSWGEPYSVIYPAPGTAVVTYTKIYDGPIGGNTEPYADEVVYSAISNDSYGLPPQNDTYYCKTSFTIQNSEVIDYSFNGDDCIAEE